MSPSKILEDANFKALPEAERIKVMRTADPSFATLPEPEQYTVIAPRTVARRGLKAPDAIEAASVSKGLGTSPNSSILEQFGGTLMTDLAAAPEAAYNVVRHPFHTATGVVQSIAHIPRDLVEDIKQGQYGKLGARALELIIPGLGSSKARELAAAADAAASRTAGKIAGSKLPEAISAEFTPNIVKRIRERLNPTPQAPAPFTPSSGVKRSMPQFTPYSDPSAGSPGVNIPRGQFVAPESAPIQAPQAPIPFRPNPNIAKRMRYGGATDEGFSTPKATGKVSPSQRLTAPGEVAASAGDAQKLISWFKSSGLSQADAELLDTGDWKLAAQGAGVPFSPETIKLAIAQLPTKSQLKPRSNVRRLK